MAKRKIVVKTITDHDIKPMHFCIIDLDLANQHMQLFNLNYDNFISRVAMWATEDFDIVLQSINIADVREFKSQLETAIRQKMHSELPEEMLSWNLINGWVSTHMRKELELYGTE